MYAYLTIYLASNTNVYIFTIVILTGFSKDYGIQKEK